MADGHLSKDKSLIISLSSADKIHLEKFASYINYPVKMKSYVNSFNGKMSEACYIQAYDTKLVSKWLDRFNIKSAKTYTPPDLKFFLEPEKLIYFFIGFIDGDGCIWVSKNWPQMRIEVHNNWLNTLQLIAEKLKEFYDIDCKVKQSKKSAAKLEINTKKDLCILLKYIKAVDYLERKWEKLTEFSFEKVQ